MKGGRSVAFNTNDAGINKVDTLPASVQKTGTVSGSNATVRIVGTGTLFYKQSPSGQDPAGRTSDLPGEVEENGYLWFPTTKQLRKIKHIYNALLLEISVPLSSAVVAENVYYIPPHNILDTYSILVTGSTAGKFQGADGKWSTISSGTSTNKNNANKPGGLEPVAYDANSSVMEIKYTY